MAQAPVRTWRVVFAFMAVLSIACGRESSRVADSAVPQEVAPSPTARTPADPQTITPALIALGDSVFHGQAGGSICYTCHGPEGKGTLTVAPDLTDTLWLHGTGTYDDIIRVITEGVPRPKESSAPMPPMGGAPLTPRQIEAVAAYVYTLRKPGPQ